MSRWLRLGLWKCRWMNWTFGLLNDRSNVGRNVGWNGMQMSRRHCPLREEKESSAVIWLAVFAWCGVVRADKLCASIGGRVLRWLYGRITFSLCFEWRSIYWIELGDLPLGGGGSYSLNAFSMNWINETD